MIAYTAYSTDARVRREAETVASLPDHHVTVLALKEQSEARVYWLDGVEVKELSLAKYRGKSTLSYLSAYLKFLALSFAECLRVSLKGHRPDVIHVHNMPNFIVFAALPARFLGSKIILDIHDTLIETYSTKFSGIFARLIAVILGLEESISCALAHRVVAVNDVQKQTLLDRGVNPSKLIVLMNLPDPKRFQLTEQRRKEAANGAFRLVYFGTINKRLGIDLAIRAIHQIHADCPGIRFHIIGTGDDRDECLALSQQFGLDGMVHFSQGALTFDELVPLVRSMDAVVIPNRRNAATELMLPVKMMEGIALGLAVFAPRLKAIEHYFDADQMFYFEPDDADSLGEAIAAAYHDRCECDRRARNAQRFGERFSWNTHRMDLIGMYRSLLAPSQ
jgi:glycosyltransferase involved in cell wall biosynthesis